MPASHSAHNLAAMVPAAAELPTFGSVQNFQYTQAAAAAVALAQSVSSLSSESTETGYGTHGGMSGSSSALSGFPPTTAFAPMHPHAFNGASSDGSLPGFSAGDPALIVGSTAPSNSNSNANLNANTNTNMSDLLMRVVGELGSIESRLARVESGTRLRQMSQS